AQHIPLNRQSQRFKCEGIDLCISTLADQVGAGVFTALALYRLIEAHVLAAERLHGDDTTVSILAGGGQTHRCAVRDPNATSTDLPPRSGWPPVGKGARRCWPSWRPSCVSSAPSCRAPPP